MEPSWTAAWARPWDTVLAWWPEDKENKSGQWHRCQVEESIDSRGVIVVRWLDEPGGTRYNLCYSHAKLEKLEIDA